jgi:hypothetical protein
VCTLSWVPLGEGYALAFNRDELRTRAPARPPELREVSGLSVLAPIDGDAGGTWIAANALGHTVTLLNRWDETPVDAAGEFVSRGLLVLALSPLPDPHAVESLLDELPLPRYRPFTVVSMAPRELPLAFEWNGRALTRAVIEAPGLARTSSGRDQAGAERVRGRIFRDAAEREGGLTPETLERLHRAHDPERGALSICMHREEAETVSGSFVRVDSETVRFKYVDGPPGEWGMETDLVLPRLRPGDSR